MRAYTLLAPAKINLYLEIVGDRPDGYHELIMVMQSVDLCDRLEVRANGTNDIRLLCDHPEVPLDQSNLAYRAATLMCEQFPDAFERYGGVDIYLEKNIPIGAGLAGGSGNAAATLVGIDLLWKLGLTQSEIQDLGAQLGSDVPFSVAGGTALATGRGENLATLNTLDQLYVVLAKYRSFSVSTPWAYKTYRQQFHETYLRHPNDLEERRKHIHSGPMMGAIAHHDALQIAQHLHNDLEKVVLPAYPAVKALRDAFQQTNCLAAMMSGSGPTVFGLAETQEQAEAARQQIRQAIADPDLELWVAKFISKGIQVAT